ncbi:MAG TPA: ferritin [Clostridiaceae bacterium]|nr:ferritin [Clostridiaceae bacterium]
MLSKTLNDAINEQINYELLSSYLYLSMSAYCEAEDFLGSAAFFRKQAQEEVGHAMKFYHYLTETGSRVILKGFGDPDVEFAGFEDLFRKSLEHEKSVTARIGNIMDMAIAEKSHATVSFLNWFVDEQVEEESTFETILGKIKFAKGAPAGLYLLDKELGARA